ncbi:MAG: hypothetical protein AB7F28_02980 [Candidatus Margulisiibacteriota bacterium]
MHRFLSLLKCLLIAWIVFLPTVLLALPASFVLQATLKDEHNIPLQGTKTTVINLYEKDNTSVLWTDTISTTFTNGNFKLAIGSDTKPLNKSLFLKNGLEIELVVNGVTLTRIPFSAFPYAFYARDAQFAESITGTLNASQISGIIPLSNLPTLNAGSADWTSVTGKPVFGTLALKNGISEADITGNISISRITGNIVVDWDNISNKPAIPTSNPPVDWNSVGDKPVFGALALKNGISEADITGNISISRITGNIVVDWDNISNKPVIPTSNPPVDWNSVGDKPVFGALALKNGISEADITGNISISRITGNIVVDWDNISNKPVIPTSNPPVDWNSVGDKPVFGALATRNVISEADITGNISISRITGNIVVDWDNISGKPTFSSGNISAQDLILGDISGTLNAQQIPQNLFTASMIGGLGNLATRNVISEADITGNISISRITGNIVVDWDNISNKPSIPTSNSTTSNIALITNNLVVTGNLVAQKGVYITQQDNGSSAAIDWTSSTRQKITLATTNPTFTFTAPPQPGMLMLIVYYSASSSLSPSWPANVKWPSGTVPTLSGTIGKNDIIQFYYDGTSYFGLSIVGFQ